MPGMASKIHWGILQAGRDGDPLDPPVCASLNEGRFHSSRVDGDNLPEVIPIRALDHFPRFC